MHEFTFKRIDQMTGREMFCVERLRCDVFVSEQKITLPELDDDDLKAVQVFLLNPARTIALAACRIFQKNGAWQLGRVAVKKDARHQHLATEMLKAVHSFLQKRGAKEISCHAQLTALLFYQNMGYQKHGPVFLEGGVRHVLMSKKF